MRQTGPASVPRPPFGHSAPGHVGVSTGVRSSAPQIGRCRTAGLPSATAPPSHRGSCARRFHRRCHIVLDLFSEKSDLADEVSPQGDETEEGGQSREGSRILRQIASSTVHRSLLSSVSHRISTACSLFVLASSGNSRASSISRERRDGGRSRRSRGRVERGHGPGKAVFARRDPAPPNIAEHACRTLSAREASSPHRRSACVPLAERRAAGGEPNGARSRARRRRARRDRRRRGHGCSETSRLSPARSKRVATRRMRSGPLEFHDLTARPADARPAPPSLTTVRGGRTQRDRSADTWRRRCPAPRLTPRGSSPRRRRRRPRGDAGSTCLRRAR